MCLQYMIPCVSIEMNQILLAEFTAQEVEEAMFMMNSMGAPSSDGFPTCFIIRIGLL